MDGIEALHLEQRRVALACADVGFFELDPEAGVIQLDRRASDLLGVAPDGKVAIDECLDSLDPGDRDRVAARLEAAVSTGGDAYHDEFRTRSRRWVAGDGRVLHDSTQRRVVLVGRLCDVTLRRTTEDARSRLIDEMARALRFNDMLIGMVAHDLKSPLEAVLADAGLAGRGTPDPAAQGGLSRIVESAGRMTRIVQQLLDVTHARLDGQLPLRTQRVDLATIARQVSDEITAAHPGGEITIEASGQTTCVCDPDRIAQVLSNLLTNAVQHGTGARAIRVAIDGTGPAMLISVTNAGVIVSDQTLQLFNPFRRLRGDPRGRDRRHGLGLGLYIARRIVLGHGGEITMTASETDGTTFRVELPRLATAAAFSLTPEQGEEEAISLQRLGIAEPQSRVTATLFGVLPLHERAPEAFTSLVERHARLLELSLDRQIYRGVGNNLATDLRDLADQLGTMGAGAHDVAELHSRALQAALKGSPALKSQTLISEGRLLALELMGRLLTFYRKRSGFGALPRGPSDRGD